ncbi:DUF5686 and carboxypeptidase regulatory-like domain-containing protein [uncultured Flavobacterium sp.]|uniref:DUF5686 and carboxypeptidase regulatory-like domain-containing protein n=1 Tax=uncultured Flavobacterium sp. TaxID=165435 RepID=UPI0025FAF159|nr:DUF5686 and carboxypeptidase regulatory-like domain-containing protein [uncultured Flavobacterium sp.]
MKYALPYLFLLFTVPFFAQVKGRIVSPSGKPVPFASILQSGTYNGTSSNEEGYYTLPLSSKGKYTLVFRSMGFATKEVTADIGKFPHTLNVTLQEESYQLEEIVITNKNDQARMIISEAIASRKENFAKTARFEADFYSRGTFVLKDVPDKILGQEIGDIGGSIDTTGSGIIYLSETVSRVQAEKPGKMREVVIASKVSGEDSGFSYNSAETAEFDFYQNFLPFEVRVVSPIADNAFNYYDYKFENSFYDSERLISKIKVLPKKKNEAAVNGYIYIVDDTWELYATDFTLKGSQIEQPLLDSISIRQNFGYNAKEKLWTKNVQTLDINAGLFGVGLSGRFSYVYSNFKFYPQFNANTFGPEVQLVETDANKKPDAYWNGVRPIPLTPDERNDYLRKDGLQELRRSRQYLDSIDHERNRFKWTAPVLGYTYHNSEDDWEIKYTGIATRLAFNTVQAYWLAPGFHFTKYRPDSNTYTTFGTDLNYGFAEQRFRMTGTFSHKFNNFSKRIVTVTGGSRIEQFNPENPINKIVNSISTLFFRDNYAKFYDNAFIKIAYEEEVLNGIQLNGSVEYARRHALYNNTNFSTLKDIYKPYLSNNPQLPFDNETPAFLKHNLMKASLQARFSFGQKYRTRPDGREIITNPDYPRLYLKYEKGFASSIGDYDFDHLSTRITYTLDTGNKGETGMAVRAGKFFNSENIAFTDYRHFNGNQTHIGKSERYLNVFNFLPYYTHSTNDQYFEGHLEHNFKGYITNKLPLISELNYHLVLGVHALSTPERKPYMEFTAGFDNLGWGKFRFLRIDYIRSYESGFLSDGVIFGLTFLDILE